MAGIADEVTAELVESHLIARPTGVLSEVEHETTFESLRDGIATEVAPVLGGATSGTARWRLGVWAASIGTAAMIESALWPEQQGPGDLGRAEFLWGRYQELIDRLRRWVGGPDNEGGDGGASGVPSPVGRFPKARPYPDPAERWC